MVSWRRLEPAIQPLTMPYMHLGISSYSFSASLARGDLDLLGMIDWIAESAAEHLELATIGLGADLPAQPDLVEALRDRAAVRGVGLTGYCVGADLRGPDRSGQIAKLKAHIDVAHRLGIPQVRHDVVEWAWRESDQAELEETFDAIVPACQELADYAAARGMSTCVENHGFCFNNSERICRLVHLVDRPNFGLAVDIGNFLCVDEQPGPGVAATIGRAIEVHLKDFYVRRSEPGQGWLRTLNGSYLRGSIVGFGDLDIPELLGITKASGFDGPMSIEFEGAEEPLAAAQIALENIHRIWATL